MTVYLLSDIKKSEKEFFEQANRIAQEGNPIGQLINDMK